MEIDASRDLVDHRLRRSAIRDVNDVDSSRRAKHLGREMSWRTIACRSEGQLSRLRLRQGDQFLHRLHAQSRIGHQDHRRRRDVHDRHEIPDRVVGKLATERDVHVQRRRGEQQCVAVRRRLRNGVVSDRSAGPCLVLDDDWLPERLLERVLHGAQHDIRNAPGRPRNDYVYRSVRIMGLRGCDADRCCTCEKHGNYAGQSTHHEPPPDPTGCRILIV